jgi:hypothetical protein
LVNEPEQLDFNLDEVRATSLDLLDYLEGQDITVGDAAAALSLSLARMAHDRPLKIGEEIMLIQAFMNFASMLSMSGGTIH